MNHKQLTLSRHKQLLDFFLNGYATMCAHMDTSCQQGLKDAAPLVFSKWYYTATAANTLLSPANIIGQNMDGKKDGKEYQYTLQLNPAEQDLKNCEFTLLSYSLESHPLVEDLRKLTDFCVPDCNIDENLFFIKEDRAALLKELSHQHEFYLEYLTRLAWWMGLFVYMPAIHTKKVQRSPFCDTLFSQSTESILNIAIEAACELAAERFSFSMDLEQDIATPDFFKKSLSVPTETDQIFVDFYKRVDVDIEEIWKTQPQDLTEDDKAIISSFLFTGILLDKWFIFPMSSFFGIIRPISFTPLNYFNLVNNLSSLLIMEHNIGAELFTPPSYFSLTPLGQNLFGNNMKEEEKYIMPRKLSYEDILEALNREIEVNRFEEVFYMGAEKDIYALRVAKKEDPEIWKIIEVGTTTPLDEFCRDLGAAFTMDYAADYLLTVLDENRFPMDYSPLGSKRSINKTAGKTLEDLWLDKGDTFSLSYTKTSQLSLEVLEITDGNPFVLYPRVKVQSQKVTEIEKVDEIF